MGNRVTTAGEAWTPAWPAPGPRKGPLHTEGAPGTTKGPGTMPGPFMRRADGSRGSARDHAEGLGPYLVILVTRPEPTVRPPSRMAKPRPSSIAMGWISSTDISVLSPGMTISVPSGRVMTPVTSVVRK